MLVKMNCANAEGGGVKSGTLSLSQGVQHSLDTGLSSISKFVAVFERSGHYGILVYDSNYPTADQQLKGGSGGVSSQICISGFYNDSNSADYPGINSISGGVVTFQTPTTSGTYNIFWYAE